MRIIQRYHVVLAALINFAIAGATAARAQWWLTALALAAGVFAALVSMARIYTSEDESPRGDT